MLCFSSPSTPSPDQANKDGFAGVGRAAYVYGIGSTEIGAGTHDMMYLVGINGTVEAYLEKAVTSLFGVLWLSYRGKQPADGSRKRIYYSADLRTSPFSSYLWARSGRSPSSPKKHISPKLGTC